MTIAEHYYQKQYRHYLRILNNPATQRIELQGEIISAEKAAELNAVRDTKVYIASQRKISICCKDMRENQLLSSEDYQDDMPVKVHGNYKDPDGPPLLTLSGNIIRYCPFCGSRIVVLPYVDEEYSPEPDITRGTLSGDNKSDDY